MLRSLLLISLLAGCESYVGTQLLVTVDTDLTNPFDTHGPGLVDTTIGPAAPLCEARSTFETRVSNRHFGCVADDDPEVREESAWIVPIPDHWDAEAFCDTNWDPGEEFHIPDDAWSEPWPEPGDDDPIVTGDTVLRREALGCGGTWSGELVLEGG